LNKALLLFLLIFFVNIGIAHVPQIKVRLASSLSEIQLAGMDLEKNLHLDNSKKIFPGKKVIQFDCAHEQTSLQDRSKPMLVASLHSKAGLVSWENKKYRGQIFVTTTDRQNGCDLINELSLEAYISSLLAKEMNAKWPTEALKAQAVAARSYAYDKLVNPNKDRTVFHFDIENSEKDQVNGSFFDETSETNNVARETKGEILTLKKNGELTPIFYHSKCGGRTFKPSQVWANIVDGYENVDCPFCSKHGTKNWEHKLSSQDFENILNKVLKTFNNDKIENHLTQVVPNQSNESQLGIYDGTNLKMVQKSRIRSTLGRGKIPSNHFQVYQEKDTILIKGSGNGHGAGMCQFGAFELAKRGYNYKQILAFYYPNHKIEKIY